MSWSDSHRFNCLGMRTPNSRGKIMNWRMCPRPMSVWVLDTQLVIHLFEHPLVWKMLSGFHIPFHGCGTGCSSMIGHVSGQWVHGHWHLNALFLSAIWGRNHLMISTNVLTTTSTSVDWLCCWMEEVFQSLWRHVPLAKWLWMAT